jgi:hypothetical protein|tara:strand:+ start:1635 stop:2219 length:585 start_codon:yes stop_codon:yes gene_type:complete
MEIIIHRVNSIKKLKKIPKYFGVEIDIRSFGSKLILNHDPHKSGDNLENFLKQYNHGTLILNIKEDGIENEVLMKVKKAKIKSFFLLDVEFPYIFKCLKKRQRNIAIRFSENETIETAKLMVKKFKWLWIDTLTKLPITKKNIKIINKYKSCLVCPERWGRAHQIDIYKKKLKNLKFKPSAVMTSYKYAHKWLD